MELTLTTVVSASAVIAALLAIYNYFSKVVRWMDKQKKQDDDLIEIRKHHDEDMKQMREEQALLCYGVLACLRGLQQQGVDGIVTDAITKLEKHLNEKAHGGV